MIFKSPNILFHILRGILGFGFLAIALQYAEDLGWWTAVPVIAALICLGGCPMCWIVGLVETALRRKPSARCADGSCGIGTGAHEASGTSGR